MFRYYYCTLKVTHFSFFFFFCFLKASSPVYLFILGDICFEFSALYYLASIATFVTYCAFVFSLLSNFKIELFQNRSLVSWERHQGMLVQSKGRLVQSKDVLWGDLMRKP